MSDSLATKLPTDQYYIRNEEAFAGRNTNEDFSLNPKAVYCPSDAGPQLWNLKALPNGRYNLSAGGPTKEHNKHLYVLLIEQEKAEEWIITKAEKQSHEHHRNLYLIEKADRSGGWVAQTDLEHPQIAILPLKEGRSHPPFYPLNQLWNIQALVD